MIANEEEARAYCASLLNEATLEQFDRFAQLLADENDRQNLVSGSSLAAVWQRHFADSLQLLDHVPRETGIWLDLGTGAGFPGLAIALARPDWPVVLVESRKRRVEWLEQVAAQMGLQQCRVVGSRLEDVESFPASVISARAFAPLPKLLSLSARFSTRDTVWLLPKGRSAVQELAKQPAPVRQMFHVEPSQTDDSAGILIGKGALGQP